MSEPTIDKPRGQDRAQDVFSRMLREHVAPALRDRGFRGSGQTFELRDARFWAILGFQRSRHSRADELEFTINVAVVAKDTWEELRGRVPKLGKRPAPSDVIHAGALRLDQVAPDAPEAWWLVRPDTDPRQVATGVLATIADHVLPWVHSRVGRGDAPHTLTAALAGTDATDTWSGEDELLV